MLAVAGALGSLSFVTHLEQIHFGPGAIPAWVPLALDAAIAGAAGLILTLGARLFDDSPAEPSGDYVVVAKSVWEGIQHEVVAARGGKPVTPPVATRPALVSEAAPAPALPPAPNPWDEGPPLTSEERSRLRSNPSEGENLLAGVPIMATHPLPKPAVGSRPSTPSTGEAKRSSYPVVAPPSSPPPVSPPKTVPSAPAAAPAPSPAEIEEMVRMGGIMGIVQQKGESGADYTRRLARELDALSKPLPPESAPKAAGPAPVPSPDSTEGASPDIDELMSWLDKLKEEQSQAPLASPPKKDGRKGDVSESSEPR